MTGKYDEIINLPHHVSATRPQMPMSDRAAQFAPFAALTGYDDVIDEAGRLTEHRVSLEEDSVEALNAKLRFLRENLADSPEAEFTYFKPDAQKSGGAYLTTAGKVKKIDEYERIIIMKDGVKIRIDDVIEIQLL